MCVTYLCVPFSRVNVDTAKREDTHAQESDDSSLGFRDATWMYSMLHHDGADGYTGIHSSTGTDKHVDADTVA